jgi:signal transduction histidine kinase
MHRIKNQFLFNYALMFIISTMVALFAFLLMDFSSDVISKTLIKNNYTAESLMKDDFREIDTTTVVNNGGGIQVVDKDYKVIFTEGLNTFPKNELTPEEFTDFLTASKSKGVLYSYSIKYNPRNKFWLIVTFPTSIRIDFAIVHNTEYASQDMKNVVGVIVAIVLFYLILLTISTIIYSRITSTSIVNPLKKLCLSARKLRDGDYSERVNLNLENEFGELQDTFNAMAQQIEHEISLRKQSEENRKKLVLDISHDLKNPLASIMGYAELCRNTPELSKEALDSYTRIIYENSVRANALITDLFELSKMESSEFKISKRRVDICEYMRETMGTAISFLDKVGFTYDFNIPEDEIFTLLDRAKMDRVFQNLTQNAIQYNPKGTEVSVKVLQEKDEIVIVFKDNGIGIPANAAKGIFQPFVRGDSSRNSLKGGTGLGLAIVEKIISAHGGSVSLKTDINCGCEFIIHLPNIEG